jgi:hypothetical protein
MLGNLGGPLWVEMLMNRSERDRNQQNPKAWGGLEGPAGVPQ